MCATNNLRLHNIELTSCGFLISSFIFTVPIAQILGGPDIFVDKDSTINLTCVIRFSLEPPGFIFWFHHDDVSTLRKTTYVNIKGEILKVISYDSNRQGVSVITEKGTDVTTSFLLIKDADIGDSGKYSCSPSNADVASVKVHVLNGKNVNRYLPRPLGRGEPSKMAQRKI